ncbi:MAG: DMT family transporter [Acidobacteria bacterium]|nr:DMT family transporter [Acidobacteriota bacterium]
MFGAATPASKVLLASLTPFQLAGLLYLCSAVAVAPAAFKHGGFALPRRTDHRNQIRLLGAVLFGGILGPVALLFGLRLAAAASVSLWLNLELAATAVLGALIFRDELSARGWLGVAVALSASALLAWGHGAAGLGGRLSGDGGSAPAGRYGARHRRLPGDQGQTRLATAPRRPGRHDRNGAGLGAGQGGEAGGGTTAAAAPSQEPRGRPTGRDEQDIVSPSSALFHRFCGSVPCLAKFAAISKNWVAATPSFIFFTGSFPYAASALPVTPWSSNPSRQSRALVAAAEPP